MGGHWQFCGGGGGNCDGEAVAIVWRRRWQLCGGGGSNCVGEAVAIMWERR